MRRIGINRAARREGEFIAWLIFRRLEIALCVGTHSHRRLNGNYLMLRALPSLATVRIGRSWPFIFRSRFA